MKHFLHLLRQRPWGVAGLLAALLLTSVGPTLAQNINRVEFFLDTDPGYGNATAVTLPTAGAPTLTGLSIPVPLGALSTGFHSLYIRTRVGTAWSQTIRRVLYVDNTVGTAPANLSRVEFFMDTDPGFGLASSVTPTGSTATGLGFVVPLGALTVGFHNLYFRTRDVNGQWSQTQKRAIFVDATMLSVISINDASTSLFPNPAGHSATLEVRSLSGSAALPIDVLDNLGRVVLHLTAPVRAGVLRTELPTDRLPAGVYAVRVQTPNRILIRQLVRE